MKNLGWLSVSLAMSLGCRARDPDRAGGRVHAVAAPAPAPAAPAEDPCTSSNWRIRATAEAMGTCPPAGGTAPGRAADLDDAAVDRVRASLDCDDRAESRYCRALEAFKRGAPAAMAARVRVGAALYGPERAAPGARLAFREEVSYLALRDGRVRSSNVTPSNAEEERMLRRTLAALRRGREVEEGTPIDAFAQTLSASGGSTLRVVGRSQGTTAAPSLYLRDTELGTVTVQLADGPQGRVVVGLFPRATPGR